MNYTSYRDTFKFFDSPYPNVLRLAAGLRNNLALFRLFFGPPEPPYRFSDDPAVIDAYLGSHQDVDLGVVTGRIDGDLNTSAMDLIEQIEEERAAGVADAEIEGDKA